MSELRETRRAAGNTTPELAFEWALLQAVDGNVADVGEYLQRRADADPGLQRTVWEALAEGYLAVYRANDAYTVAQQWASRFPDDPRALELRGRAAIQGRGRGLTLGADDLRQVLTRDPTRTKARTTLSITLLELGRFDEAIAEFERLAREQPDLPDHRVRLARCQKMTDRPARAVELLDEVLRTHPDHGLALRTRGQFALSDLQTVEATGWLRRAVEALPNDYQSHYLYYQALLQAGQTAAAAEQLQRSETVKQQTVQLAELRTRRLAERPLDPTPSTEMGSLLLTTGNTVQGLRWLDVALSLDPGFRPAHEVLARHFEKAGNREQAESHRRQAAAAR
jgi:predicted Zn-dependent protease